MPNGEHDPTGKTPDRQQSQEIQRVGMPAIIYDNAHAVAVSRNEKGSLIVRISTGGTPLFTAAVSRDDDVHVLFPRSKKPSPQSASAIKSEQQPAGEQQETLPLPITIEGYPVRPAKYDAEKRHYSLTIGHHPNPKDRKQTIYYELVADGDKADVLYALRITETRTPVHVTGIDCSQEVARKGSKSGEKKMVHRIEADSIEKITRRMDNPDVLREKVRLADQA